MKMFASVVLACSILAATAVAHADTLNGTTVSGNLSIATNPFTTSSAIIGPGVEFNTAGTYKYAADFSDTGFLFNVSCTGTIRMCAAVGAVDYTATFTDAAFLGGTFSSALANGIGIQDFSYNLDGATLTITGLPASQGSEALSFTPGVAVTPEPSSFILLGTGLLGAAGMLRRRFLA